MNNLLLLLRLLKSRCHLWLPGYFGRNITQRKNIRPEGSNIHIIFLIVDHFEPSRKEGELGVKKVREWCEGYAKIAGQHHDSDGVHPQHSWFYRYDYPNFDCIGILSEFAYRDFGEIEFHLHHGYDTPESFYQTLLQGVEWFNKAGAMISAEDKPKRRFGYIAGNWALDNGRKNPAYSGVNTELLLLNKAGCYADYTFPAMGTIAQPQKVNSIYYAKDTSSPKSYNTGQNVVAGGKPSGDLMIFQGPIYIDWREKYTESAALELFAPYRPVRINNWIKAGVHVVGRPEWIFVKLHTHGMQSRDVFISENLHDMFSDLENRLTRPPFHLHYVTAREAYNIVKAAEAGKKGNPHHYRNYTIQQPTNRKLFCNQPYKLDKYSNEEIIIHLEKPSDNTTIRFKELPVQEVMGDKIKRLELVHSGETLKRLQIDGSGACVVTYREITTVPGTHARTQKINLPYSQTW